MAGCARSWGVIEDFWSVTQEALAYTLNTPAASRTPHSSPRWQMPITGFCPYPDAAQCLKDLAPLRLAILSNGAPGMLQRLVANAGIAELLDEVISVNSKAVFKPHPRAYEMVEEALWGEAGERPVCVVQRLRRRWREELRLPRRPIARLPTEKLARELEASPDHSADHVQGAQDAGGDLRRNGELRGTDALSIAAAGPRRAVGTDADRGQYF